MSDFYTMPAGREMDALVAEKVLGATWRSYPEILGGRMRLLTFDASSKPLATGSERDAGPHMDIRRYSTDIAAAWEVVEKLVANGACPLVEYDEQRRVWACEIDPKWTGEVATASTAPLAICRAALAAAEATDA